MYGIVTDLYRNLVKLKTKSGEIVIKSNKKIPKGLKVEVKKMGDGDFKGKILAGPSVFLPSTKNIYYATKITEDERFIEKIAFVFEEISKRIVINKDFLKKFKQYFDVGEIDSGQKIFGNYFNLLSGKYGFRSYENSKVFIEREKKEFTIYAKNNIIYGVIENENIVLKTDKVIENIEELKEKLKKYFANVFVTVLGFEGGKYG